MNGSNKALRTNWLSYWKVSLADMELGRGVFTARQMQNLRACVLSQERIGDQFLDDSQDWLHAGGDHQVLTLATVRDWLQGDPKGVMFDGQRRWIQGVVYPFVYLLEKRHQHGYSRRQFVPQMVAPVSFTVRLYEDGWIYPEGRPGVPRELLEPSNGARPFVLANVDDLDRFFDEHPFPEWEDPVSSRWSLSEVINYCHQMLHAISRVDLECPMGDEGPRYMALADPLIHKGRAGEGAIRPLLNIYDTLIHKSEGIRAVNRLTQWQRSSRLVPSIEQSVTTRTGSMQAMALSGDQKSAIASALQVPVGHVQAINGPPGTGKTTVIKDAVASLVVQAALEKKAPPLIGIASNNNQAVTNVLDVFSRADGEQQVTRWVPEWVSFGMYAPSMARAERAEQDGYATVERMRERERGHDPHASERHFLACASDWAGRDLESLEQAQAVIQRRMRRWASALSKVRELHRRFEAIDRTERLNAARVIVQKLAQTTGEASNPAFEQLAGWLREIANQIRAIETERHHGEWINGLHSRLRAEVPGPVLSAAQRSSLVCRHVLPLMAPDVALEAGRFWRDVVHRYTGVGTTSQRQQALRDIGASPEWPRVIAELDDVMDRTCRAWLFEASVHWFEAQWLKAMATVTNEKQRSGRGHHHVMAALERRAMLAPVMVGTFYTLPRHISYWDPLVQQEMPLSETLDYLLIDESGQATVEVAVPTVALAKRVVSIGDVHQLGPVRRIARPIDIANLVATGVAPPAEDVRELERTLETFSDAGKLSHNTTLLEIIRPLSVFHAQTEVEAGARLVKHRRCVPPIIEFCNRLCYEGQLEALREAPGLDIEGIHWLHVPGLSQRERGSQINAAEASVIAHWVRDHADALQRQYAGQPLSDIVGIVTPFTQQANCIERALAQAGVDSEGMTVGTIHALQGAERPVVILSLTYNHPSAQALFFDSEPQMLNVAVSRARDALVVAGDSNVLVHGDRPARLLWDHLRRNTAPAPLPAMDPQWWAPSPGDVATVLEGRDEHDQWLAAVMEQRSWKRLVIASPVLGLMACQHHGARLVEAAARGCEVTLVISREHSMVNGYDRALLEIFDNFRRGGVDIRIAEWFEGSWVNLDDTLVAITDGDWLSQMPDVRDWGIERRRPQSLIVENASARAYLSTLTIPEPETA